LPKNFPNRFGVVAFKIPRPPIVLWFAGLRLVIHVQRRRRLLVIFRLARVAMPRLGPVPRIDHLGVESRPNQAPAKVIVVAALPPSRAQRPRGVRAVVAGSQSMPNSPSSAGGASVRGGPSVAISCVCRFGHR
jgi:hypothetical protein